ncbi:MAG TPA: hypothetical protein VHL80_09375 [Polyangia bacterium]|nr:hypothetical protein [Polyangia bacterium]
MADPTAGAPAPEVYRLSMEKLPLAVGRARRLTVVQVLAGVTALVALTSLGLSGTVATDASLVVWGLGVVFLPYALWRARLVVRRRWNAFELSLGPTNMRCAARGYGRVTIPLDEITSITEGASGLVVRAAGGTVIRIPRTVEGFVDVRARLERRRPIAARTDAALWSGALAALALPVAWIALFWGRRGCLAAAVFSCQAAAVWAAGVEVRWHPRLSRGRKLVALAALAFALALPALAFVVGQIVFSRV